MRVLWSKLKLLEMRSVFELFRYLPTEAILNGIITPDFAVSCPLKDFGLK